jgi:peptidoglycan/LPS O-acetylase OafA/YrhL
MSCPASSRHSSRQHFLGLDGLRGVAAFAVVFLHGTQTWGIGYVPDAANLAVDFFFLLSGFVIAYAYDERLGSGMTWRQFMAVRLVRLYPMLFVGTAAGGLVFVLSQMQTHDFDISTSLLMTAGTFALLPVGLAAGLVAYPVNNPAWSLFFEFAVSALYGSRFGRLGKRGLAAFVAASGAALIAVAAWGGPYDQIGSATPTAFLLGFVRVAYSFWAGVLLFRVARLRTMPSVPIGIIGCTLALLLLAPADGPAYSLLLALVVFPVLVAFAACASFGSPTARVCSAFGRLSYPLYLIHQPVFRMIHGTSRMMHLGLPAWVMLAGAAVVSVVAAETLLIAFDEPVRMWLGGRLRHNRPAALARPR